MGDARQGDGDEFDAELDDIIWEQVARPGKPTGKEKPGEEPKQEILWKLSERAQKNDTVIKIPAADQAYVRKDAQYVRMDVKDVKSAILKPDSPNSLASIKLLYVTETCLNLLITKTYPNKQAIPYRSANGIPGMCYRGGVFTRAQQQAGVSIQDFPWADFQETGMSPSSNWTPGRFMDPGIQTKLLWTPLMQNRLGIDFNTFHQIVEDVKTKKLAATGERVEAVQQAPTNGYVFLDEDPLAVYRTFVNIAQLANYLEQFPERQKATANAIQGLVLFFQQNAEKDPQEPTVKRRKLDDLEKQGAEPEDENLSLTVALNSLKQSQASGKRSQAKDQGAVMGQTSATKVAEVFRWTNPGTDIPIWVDKKSTPNLTWGPNSMKPAEWLHSGCTRPPQPQFQLLTVNKNQGLHLVVSRTAQIAGNPASNQKICALALQKRIR
jgi:hypothetical protein